MFYDAIPSFLGSVHSEPLYRGIVVIMCEINQPIAKTLASRPTAATAHINVASTTAVCMASVSFEVSQPIAYDALSCCYHNYGTTVGIWQHSLIYSLTAILAGVCAAASRH